MIRSVLRRVCLALIVLAGVYALADAAPPRAEIPKSAVVKASMQRYETDYYIIFTDQDANMVREASTRMKVMAEEYYRRTKGFGGVIKTKFPFYIYSDPNDYYAAGGMKGSAGVYIHMGASGRLMAIAAPSGASSYMWHVVQHEAFHQFVHMVMGGKLPIWLNEGLAEYFGEAQWTGDGLVTGVIPWNPKNGSHRMGEVKAGIQNNKFLPFKAFFNVTNKDWDAKIEDKDSMFYDQAWSLVQYFVHGDDGKYRNPYGDFVCDTAKGVSPIISFSNRFGRDFDPVEKRYRQWWLELKDDAPSDTYSQITVATLTSFLARAYGAKMKFDSAEEFFKAAEEGKLAIDPKLHPKVWLPPSLLNRALAYASYLKEWSLQTSPKGVPKLILKVPDGKTFTGTFNVEKFSPDKPPEVTVQIDDPKAPAKPADKTSK